VTSANGPVEDTALSINELLPRRFPYPHSKLNDVVERVCSGGGTTTRKLRVVARGIHTFSGPFRNNRPWAAGELKKLPSGKDVAA
jgi:hypothetical protein